MACESVAISRESAGSVDDLRGLWLSLHRHHARVGAQTGPFADDETSWGVRSAAYREWLGEPGSFLLVARREGRAVGYAMVRVTASGSELRDTWVVPEIAAELEILVIAPDSRREGLGGALLCRVDAELESQGIAYLTVGLIAGNDEAESLYLSRGFRPRWIQLARRRP